MSAMGAYAGLARLSDMDLRTRHGRILRGVRAELVAHVGGTPSATQRLLVERAAQLTLRVAIFDDRLAEGGALTDHDSRQYLAWSNSLTRTLKALGLKGETQKPRTLRDHYADKAPTTP
ncbi:hypothetical protein ACE7GA_01450 [Roseomonas sp. CCTCC AB2023176]|uniref:hypothetical protein n=1 Tax=Roseomonas sp. CCTCC AB2023176 TaxID=3342640 RepID=UPI0035DC3494